MGRKANQTLIIKKLMLDGVWRTYNQINAITGIHTVTIGIILRSFRELRNGGWTMLSRHIAHGLWEYRLVPGSRRVQTE